MAATQQCLVIVSDSGESWALNGDQQNADQDGDNEPLPQLLSAGWQVQSITPGSGAKDDTSYWLVLLSS